VCYSLLMNESKYKKGDKIWIELVDGNDYVVYIGPAKITRMLNNEGSHGKLNYEAYLPFEVEQSII
jgi:hypothetical protein